MPRNVVTGDACFYTAPFSTKCQTSDTNKTAGRTTNSPCECEGPIVSHMPKITIRTSNRLEELASLLAKELATNPQAPLSLETIIVSGRGMAQWLRSELSQQVGIAADLDMPFPGAFIGKLFKKPNQPDPFDRTALTFRIYRILGNPDSSAELGPARKYCADDPSGEKRLQLAAKLAACFDDYQLYRPKWPAKWQRNELALPSAEHEPWQAALWRTLVNETGGEAAQRIDRVKAGLRANLLRKDKNQPQVAAENLLPERLHIFSMPTLAPAFLDLIHEISEQIQVTFWLQRPTAHLQSEISHPLLLHFGKQVRQFTNELLKRNIEDFDFNDDNFLVPESCSILHTLQSDIMNMSLGGEGKAKACRVISETDDSLRVHGAHSPMREMEIVRDQLLHAFAEDPTLRPSDVMVLVPDPQTYAPYVQAVFGPVQKQLPFMLADRSPASELPIASALLRLCRLSHERFTAPDILQMLDEPAISATFSITAGDLPTIRSWIERSAIRWGNNGENRAEDYQLPAFEANSWDEGLTRLLLGQAIGEGMELSFGHLPTADGTIGRADLMGRFFAFADAVRNVAKDLATPHTLEGFANSIENALQTLAPQELDGGPSGSSQLRELARKLRQLQTTSNLQEKLSVRAFARWLERELDALGEGRSFLAGAITFAALQPMRAVPMQILCICGLADGNFPRPDHRDAFDLLGKNREPLDRSQREDDRQLFLDSILAARKKLVLTYVSRSNKDNCECPPSPVLSELLEYIDTAFLPKNPDTPASAQVFVQHPLQAFSACYGDAKDLRLFTYAAVEKTACAQAEAVVPVKSEPLTIELEQLIECLQNPSRFYCRNVLNLQLLWDAGESLADAEPFNVSNQARASVLKPSVDAQLGHSTDPLSSELALASGRLPQGPLGEVEQRRMAELAHLMSNRIAQKIGTGSHDFVLPFAGDTLRGTLQGLSATAQVTWRVRKLRWNEHAATWVRHLVLQVLGETVEGLPENTLHIAEDGDINLAPLPDARFHLANLIDLFRSARSSPVPIFEHATTAYVAELREKKPATPDEALDTARKEFGLKSSDGTKKGSNDYGNDWSSNYVKYCWRGKDPIETEAFIAFAKRIAMPMLAAVAAVAAAEEEEEE